VHESPVLAIATHATVGNNPSYASSTARDARLLNIFGNSMLCISVRDHFLN
jgi:hypothetical protein